MHSGHQSHFSFLEHSISRTNIHIPWSNIPPITRTTCHFVGKTYNKGSSITFPLVIDKDISVTLRILILAGTYFGGYLFGRVLWAVGQN